MQKVPVGPTTIGGTILALAQIAGGVVLIVVGKTPADKEAGRLLLGTGGLTQLGIVGGRMAQAVKTPKVDAVPDVKDGPWVANAEVPATTEVVGSTK